MIDYNHSRLTKVTIFVNLDANKAHGWDDISIRMIKSCGKSIPLPLKLLLKTVFEVGRFSEDWKKVMSYQYSKKSPTI